MKDYYKMEIYFKKMSTFKVRYKKGALEDKICRGLLSQDLERHFSKGSIRDAIKEKVILKESIILNSVARNHQSVYLWLDDPCRQVSWWKRIFVRVKTFFLDLRERLGFDDVKRIP